MPSPPNPRLEALLQRTMGLSLNTVGQGFTERSVRSRMLHTGLTSPEQYTDLVESDPRELQELIEAIIVPETWFFRDPEAFSALGAWAAQEWAPRHPGEILKVLSLPCSTGEEAYSIAICLLSAGLAASRFQILGMDISYRSVAQAREGVYRPNSFRGTTEDLIQLYFQRTPAGLVVDESLRQCVIFCEGNVLELPAEFTDGEFDVVFCRNLLIYFSRETQVRSLRNIERLMAKDGVLFVGSAEAYMVRAFGCQPLTHAMSFGFHRCGQGGTKPPEPKRPHTPQVPTLSKPAPALPRRPVLQASVPVNTPQAPLREMVPVKVVVDDLVAARQLADRGDFEKARALCEAGIARPENRVEYYFLLGLIEDAQNEPENAAGYYRKVLYLEPDHTDALTHMALISDRLGDTKGAERLRARAHRNGGSSRGSNAGAGPEQ